MKKILFAFFTLICFSGVTFAQIPVNTLVQIVKAEDELRFDKMLGDLMKSANAQIRTRAALAAGRIGNEAAIPALINLLEKDKDTNVQKMAAFALGEIESIKAADAILKVLEDSKLNDSVRARAVESAGKIAAANTKDEKSKELGKAILTVLEAEVGRGAQQYRETVLLGLTAILRVRPDGGDAIAAKFLTNKDSRIRTDAGNTLARLRLKNFNNVLRTMLKSDAEPTARANAARALGAAEDRDAFNLLLEAAVGDKDLRVRVSAIRALGSLKDAKAADKLIETGEKLFADYKKSKFKNPSEKNELLEIATTLGRILPNTSNEKALKFLQNFREADKFTSSETEIALARIAPKIYLESLSEKDFVDWKANSAVFQGLGEFANLESNTENNALKSNVRVLLVQSIGEWLNLSVKDKESNNSLAIPDLLRAFAAFKSENTSGIVRPFLENSQDVFIRTAAAEILGELEPNNEDIAALTAAFLETENDKFNDAALAILDALEKQYKNLPKGDEAGLSILKQFKFALESPDYLVRRKTISILKSLGLTESVPQSFEVVRFPSGKTGLASELRVVRADYARAVSRKNGSVKAVFTTEKGVFTIDLMPEDAPLTVDNFINLARSNYFNGLEVHRVVPNFVMQDGDPRGDGNGGPGWSIRCEINMLEFARGAVGMALSGKDTGGSQWFVTHSPQPHLEGGYTVFGRVKETDMKVVDAIVRGDKITSVKIIENKK